MLTRDNYPDYARISEIEKKLSQLGPRLEMERYYDEEAADLEDDLTEQLNNLVMGEQVEVEGQACREKYCRAPKRKDGGWVFGEDILYRTTIYYPTKIHHLDGNPNNNTWRNLAMVCPVCRAHILLSRLGPSDIWLLKARGLSNAEVGRLLNLSRERVRQLFKKYEAKQSAERTALIETDIGDLVKRAEHMETHLLASRRLKRRIDKRTKKKRIIAELDKLRTREVQNEGKHKAKRQK